MRQRRWLVPVVLIMAVGGPASPTASIGDGPPPTGACCLSSGICAGNLTEAQCEDAGGIWQGPSSSCGLISCLDGACCFPDETCEILTEGVCATGGGAYQGDNTDCLACREPLIACCFSTGGCIDFTESDCLLAGGTPLGPDTNCRDFECDESGACCLPDGSCADDLSPGACADMKGLYQGGATECAEVTCEVIVAPCCFETGFCALLSQENCLGAGATWLGPDGQCKDLSGDGSANECMHAGPPGDLNRDGIVDVLDLLVLLGAWGDCPDPGECPGDLDRSGAVDVFDLLILLANWG